MRVNLSRETFAICSFLCQDKLQVKEHFQCDFVPVLVQKTTKQSSYNVSFLLKVYFGLTPLICIFLLITLINLINLSLFYM